MTRQIRKEGTGGFIFIPVCSIKQGEPHKVSNSIICLTDMALQCTPLIKCKIRPNLRSFFNKQRMRRRFILLCCLHTGPLKCSL